MDAKPTGGRRSLAPYISHWHLRHLLCLLMIALMKKPHFDLLDKEFIGQYSLSHMTSFRPARALAPAHCLTLPLQSHDGGCKLELSALARCTKSALLPQSQGEESLPASAEEDKQIYLFQVKISFLPPVVHAYFHHFTLCCFNPQWAPSSSSSSSFTGLLHFNENILKVPIGHSCLEKKFGGGALSMLVRVVL